MTIENLSVTMYRPTLDQLPTFDLPATHRLRWYQPGDEAAWVAIHQAADRFHQFDAATFYQEFGTDRAQLATRQAYLCPIGENGSEGAPVGTATAWFGVTPETQKDGLVHWVAIHPAAQGQGLAKPLLAFICRRLHELGHRRVYLNTSTARIPAISLYLAFGFIPIQRGDHATTVRAWGQVRTQIDHPALDHFLDSMAGAG